MGKRKDGGIFFKSNCHMIREHSSCQNPPSLNEGTLRTLILCLDPMMLLLSQPKKKEQIKTYIYVPFGQH